MDESAISCSLLEHELCSEIPSLAVVSLTIGVLERELTRLPENEQRFSAAISQDTVSHNKELLFAFASECAKAMEPGGDAMSKRSKIKQISNKIWKKLTGEKMVTERTDW